jgi:hypothetical protein
MAAAGMKSADGHMDLKLTGLLGDECDDTALLGVQARRC